MKPLIMSTVAIVALTACGSSSGGSDGGSAPSDSSIDAFEVLQDRVDALPDPIADQLPTGTVTYNGKSELSVSLPDDIFLFVGDTEVVVDFAGDTLTGGISNVVRVLDDDSEVEYAGAVTFENGTTSLDDFRFQADYSGTVTGEGNVVFVQGDMTGGPKGESGEGLLLSGFEFPGDGSTINGEAAGIFIDVAAER